ncbi:CSTF3 [Mytilus edulis]|uniref:CSTF3 n=1 Tax=Mytilus edulis TaxID=6550 RepID=A0A8S3RNP4_MYTED|nr:CSTF3 [Mytilus edulis]
MKYEKVHTIYKRFLAMQDTDPTLGYIQYMKFARRAEGIKSARLVFKMARENNKTKYQVYVAAALMEYYCSKEKNVALKIFELGLKKYGGHPEYALCYMDFMSHLNEDNNTRVLYERSLSSGQILPEKSIEIWSRFLAFESEVGDLALPGSHPVSGGEFPPPPAAGSLLTVLPPPECFHGPFVMMDKFIEHMKNLTLPEGII